MAMIKNGQIVITQEDIDKIIKPPKSREEAIRLSKQYECEYEESKQEIINVMQRNMALYKKEQV